MSSYNENLSRYITAACNAGMTYAEADAVRRDAQRVATWDTHECNGTIQWAEAGQVDHRGRPLVADRPYWVHGLENPRCPPSGIWTRRADTFTPALARARAVADRHGLQLEYNADPRGWPFRFRTKDGREFAPPVR